MHDLPNDVTCVIVSETAEWHVLKEAWVCFKTELTQGGS
jgi:hypothetical protein